MKLLATAVWTSCSRAPFLLEESALRWGIPLHPVHRDKPWAGFYQSKVVNFWWEASTQEWDVLLHCDGGDAFFTGPDALERTEAALDSCGKDILVSGEGNCFPWPKRHGDRFTDPRPYRYPNSGIWVGRREALTDLFARFIASAENDDGYQESGWGRSNMDQVHWCEAALDGLVAVDAGNDWCLNLYGRSDAEARSAVLTRGTIAPFVHWSSEENENKVRNLYRAHVDGRSRWL
jgi:hypothetical protein